MTVEQALQLLAGTPSQEEVFAALLALAEQDESAYVGALPRAQELLAGLSGQEVPREQINNVVRGLQTQTVDPDAPQAADVTLSGDVQPAPDVPEEPAGPVGGPPPIPPEEEEQFVAPPIGVPPGFQAERETVGLPGDIGVGPGGTRQTVGVPPRYAAGDEFEFQYASPGEIRRMQKELEAAGLLESGYTPGFWDQASADALQAAMGYANRGGSSYQQVISQLKEAPRQFERGPEFVARDIPNPDPAALEQRVKAEFRGRLGREPSNAELAEFGGYLSSQYGAAEAAQLSGERAAFAEANFTEIASELGNPNLSEERAAEIRSLLDAAGGSAGTAVDPAARLQQLFDERFGPEVEFIENQSDRIRNSDNVYASLRTMTGLVGS